MTELLSGASGFWFAWAISAGVLLLFAAVWMRHASGHATRQRLGELGVFAAVAVAGLRMLPVWIPLPDVRPEPVEVAPEYGLVEPVELAWAPDGPGAEVINDSPRIPLPCAAPAAAEPAPCNAPVWSERLRRGIDLAAAAYLFIAGALLVRWALGHWALARLVGRGRPAPAWVGRVFDGVARELGVEGVRLVVNDRIGVPICCGLLRPTVVIPRSLALDNDPVALRWVFAHELTHLSRRDPWSVCGMGVAQALLFFVPWFWWVRRQVRLSQEFMADAAAAARGRWADEYAEFLVNVARGPLAPVAAAGVFGNKSDLYRRVTMVLQPNRGVNSRRQLVSGMTCLAAGAVVLAGLGVRAEAPPITEDAKKGVGVFAADADGDTIGVRVKVEGEGERKDGEKKDGDKKDSGRRRVFLHELDPFGPMAGFDKAEFEKKLRKALSAAKLDDAEVERIVRDAMNGLEQVRAAANFAQAFEWKGDAIAAMPMFPANKMFELGGLRPTGRLGIVVERPTPALVEQLDLANDQGLVITEVISGSAADKAGFKANDVLLRFGDADVSSDPAQFVKALNALAADKEYSAVVLRKGKKEKIDSIKLKPKAEPAKGLASVESGDAEKKIIVREIARADNVDAKVAKKMVTISVTNGEMTAREEDGDVVISVSGKVDGGKVSVTSVTIEEPGSKATYSSLDKVPAKFRARVEKLISNSGDSPIRFNSRKE